MDGTLYVCDTQYLITLFNGSASPSAICDNLSFVLTNVIGQWSFVMSNVCVAIFICDLVVYIYGLNAFTSILFAKVIVFINCPLSTTK